MTVYLVISLPKKLYVYTIYYIYVYMYMVLANLTYSISRVEERWMSVCFKSGVHARRQR